MTDSPAQKVVRARLGRAFHEDTCRHCHQPTLTGADSYTTAFTVHADPQPIDEAYELCALLQGRRTFDLIPAGIAGKRALERREGSATRRRYFPVVALHQCGAPVPADHIARPVVDDPAAEPPY